jgi:hypothetical protein
VCLDVGGPVALHVRLEQPERHRIGLECEHARPGEGRSGEDRELADAGADVDDQRGLVVPQIAEPVHVVVNDLLQDQEVERPGELERQAASKLERTQSSRRQRSRPASRPQVCRECRDAARVVGELSQSQRDHGLYA